MKNIIYIIFACLIVISCGDETTSIIKDDEKSVRFDWTQDDSKSNEIVEANLGPTVFNKKRDNIVDEKNVVGTPLIDEPEPEPIVEEVNIPDEIPTVVEPQPIEIDDAEKPLMVFADIRVTQLKVDKYEVSIDAFCKVFPHMREILQERIMKTLQRGAFKWPQGDINKYPAYVTYTNAVRYAESIGRRLPTTDEWQRLARGNGNKGEGNHGRGWICNTNMLRVMAVDRKGAVPNGFGVYEMTGNVEEWCKDRFAGGIYYKQCDGNIRNWFPIKVALFDNTTSGFRCVDDVE